MSVYWIPVIGIIGSFAVAVMIIYITSDAKTRRNQMRADVQMKLIDRFGSANEFIDFVSSNEGKQFLGDAPRVARANYIGGIRNGIIMLSIGIGFASLAFWDDRGWLVPGFILIGLGLGFFVSAMMTMKLSNQMESNGNSSTNRPNVSP